MTGATACAGCPITLVYKQLDEGVESVGFPCELACLFSFYAVATVFKFDYGGDMMYEMRR